eukprot:g1038.t1
MEEQERPAPLVEEEEEEEEEEDDIDATDEGDAKDGGDAKDESIDGLLELLADGAKQRVEALAAADDLFAALRSEVQGSREQSVALKGRRDALDARVSELEREREELREALAVERREREAAEKALQASRAESEQRAEAAKRNIEALQRELSGARGLAERLQGSLKESIPAKKVQSLLQTAEERVNAILVGTQEKKKAMDELKVRLERENARLRRELSNIPQLVEERAAEEIAARKRAERKAGEAMKKSSRLEERVKQIERETTELRQMLAAAKEGLGVMKTIARIRQNPAGSKAAAAAAVAARGRKGPVGFDAVSQKIDAVTRRVNQF